jgi:hypothetical protein
MWDRRLGLGLSLASVKFSASQDGRLERLSGQSQTFFSRANLFQQRQFITLAYGQAVDTPLSAAIYLWPGASTESQRMTSKSLP